MSNPPTDRTPSDPLGPEWEARHRRFLERCWSGHAADPGHDLGHVRRVVANARRLADAEGAQLEIVLPAAWLHDCAVVAKDSPQRALASRQAGDLAVDYLEQAGYPGRWIEPIRHTIEAHSFTAGITPESVEARVVQDADRLEALGAIGIVRVLLVGHHLGRPLHHPEEPIPEQRVADDSAYILDHFYTKLFGLPATMQTASGKREAERRVEVMTHFVESLAREVGPVALPTG